MTARTVRRAIWGFLGSVLLGMVMFAILGVGMGVCEGWRYPVEPKFKWKQTVLGCAVEGLCAGAFLGGIAGAIAGVGVGIHRLSEKKND